MEIHQVKEKIAKLLAIAHNTPNEQEAANAAARAHKLMQKYRIEHIAFDKDGGWFDDIGEQGTLYTSGRISVWRSMLADALAKNNFCKAYLHYSQEGKKRKNSIRIVGTKIDSDAVRDLFLYLEKEIEQLCRKFLRQKSYTKSQGRVAANSFKMGVIDVVKDRLEEANLAALKDAADQAESGDLKPDEISQKLDGALVLLSDQMAKVEKWVQEQVDPKKSPMAFYLEDDAAFLAGQKAGEKIGLNAKLEKEEK